MTGDIRDGRMLGVARPDERVRVVRGSEGRAEQYRAILPRQDRRGWRMGVREASADRVELVAPDICGSSAIHLSVVRLGVGLRDTPHFHVMGEKVMYVTQGRGRILWGEDLAQEHDVGPGDAVYVPPYAVHAPENAGEEPFQFVMVAAAAMDVSVPG
jgi:uncharacterized RmlC-like cupin family protein